MGHRYQNQTSTQLTGSSMHLKQIRGASRAVTLILIATLLLSGMLFGTRQANANSRMQYLIAFHGHQRTDGLFELGGNHAQNHPKALSHISAAGGTVVADLSRQIGIIIAESSNPNFEQALNQSHLTNVMGKTFAWNQYRPATASPNGRSLNREPITTNTSSTEPLAASQWALHQIRAPEAHSIQSGNRAVRVGVLDTGIDATHPDFVLSLGSDGVVRNNSNIDPNLGRDFTVTPGSGSPYIDDNGHGTFVAGLIAAQRNNLGILGVAPNVTLVPVKVCDAEGYCYAHSVIQGITYAGDARLNVINMSFITDDAPEDYPDHTLFKCMNDPEQRAFRLGVQRALNYARKQGVVPIASLGNEGKDLTGGSCDAVPGEAPGVIGVSGLGRSSELVFYSNYGHGVVDLAAPAGAGPFSLCNENIISTIPGGGYYDCGFGTSMAAPHVTGVAALIISQYGTLENGPNGPRMTMSPGQVQSHLEGSAIDIGKRGSDLCFGSGRVDALRAILDDTSNVYQAVPDCGH